MKKLIAVGGFAALAACATVSQMTPTGGSKSDGIVEMSFQYDMFSKVNIDQASAHAQAQQRCQVWGYQDAEPFGGVTRQCQYSSDGMCMSWFATVKYQCTGGSTQTSQSHPTQGFTGPA